MSLGFLFHKRVEKGRLRFLSGGILFCVTQKGEEHVTNFGAKVDFSYNIEVNG